MLNIFDTKPDMIVIYHAYNDLGISLTDDFASDYSHSKINFSHNYSKFELLSKLFNIKLKIYNYLVLYLLNIRYKELDIYAQTEKKTPNINNDFKGLATFQRNIEMIIKICKASDIKVVISTFASANKIQKIKNKTQKKYLVGLEKKKQTN